MSNAKGPIFIGGTGRSGTSIAGSIVSKHPEIFYVGESQMFQPTYGITGLYNSKTSPEMFKRSLLGSIKDKILASCKTRYPQKDFSSVYTDAAFEDIFDKCSPGKNDIKSVAKFTDCIFKLGANAISRKRWAEKTPHSIIQASLLLQMFPDLKFIHILRNPKDVCASTLNCSWGPDSVDEFIPYWQNLMQAALEQQQAFSQKNYLAINLEQLIADTPGTAKQIFQFAGASVTDNIIKTTTSAVNANQANINRWAESLSKQQSTKIDKACSPLLKKWQNIQQTHM